MIRDARKRDGGPVSPNLTYLLNRLGEDGGVWLAPSSVGSHQSRVGALHLLLRRLSDLLLRLHALCGDLDPPDRPVPEDVLLPHVAVSERSLREGVYLSPVGPDVDDVRCVTVLHWLLLRHGYSAFR